MELGSSLLHSQESATFPYPSQNQAIPLPITILTSAACFLPGRAKDLSAPRCCVQMINSYFTEKSLPFYEDGSLRHFINVRRF